MRSLKLNDMRKDVKIVLEKSQEDTGVNYRKTPGITVLIMNSFQWVLNKQNGK